MQYKKTNLLHDLYVEHLKSLNGIGLTHREVDLIAFFISGRSTKKIAAFFSISPKTVENHTHNIMIKFGCNSREGIIDFVEKSDKLPILRKYHAALLSHANFEKSLRTIAELHERLPQDCIIVYEQDHSYLKTLALSLEGDLKLAGVVTVLKSQGSFKRDEETLRNHYVIELKQSFDETKEVRVFCFFPEKQETIEVSKNNLLNLNELTGYFSFVYTLVRMFFPQDKIEKIIEEFESENKNDLIEFPNDHKKGVHNSISLRPKIDFLIKDLRWGLSFIVVLFILGASLYKFIISLSPYTTSEVSIKQGKEFAIRSDFDLPLKTSLLKRTELLAEIEKKLQGKEGIQTVALVGMGGAGKTTIARRYADSVQSNVVWEIHAQTKESVNESFESLAQELAKTDDEKKLLTGILKIKLNKDREAKVIQFVKEHLQRNSNWFLVYDDVKRISDIQKHFPIDPAKWGQGKIILTTQDSNIDTNRHINSTIFITELDPEEKLDLFLKEIQGSKGEISFTTEQIDELKHFLVEIPPFPLDVTAAAAYIKITHVSYQEYLENLLKYDTDFSSVQEKILEQAGDYTKTRYKILTVSFEHLVDSNEDFRDLLLFISLLDSQSVSRDLLIKFKSVSLVDNFVYRLKNYSLLQKDDSQSYHAEPTFSIHPSTQSIALAYLINKFKLTENKKLLNPIVSSLENYMAEAIDNEDFSKMKTLSRHAEQVLSHEGILDENLKASLQGELGCICYYLCDYGRAQDLLEKSIRVLNTENPDNLIKVARFHVYLGNVHKRLGNFEEAKKLFEESLALYKKVPELHVGMARASGYLGVVYEHLGDFKKAKILLEESLRIHKQFPQKQIGLAWSLAHLGSVYSNLGDYEMAKELFEQSYSIYNAHSEDYVGAAWACVDLGFIYMQLGDMQKAREFLEKSIAIYNKHFIDEHVYPARAFAYQGMYYRQTGQYHKAKKLLEKSLSAYQETYGKHHLATVWIVESLGKTYLLEGNLEKAEPILLEALEILKDNKRANRYMVLEDLSDLYREKKMSTQADSYLTQALENVERDFPENSPHVMRIREKLSQQKIPLKL